ncbi:MAG: NUDIX domain-containing protein [Patescibacteria group bacterium]
MKKLILSNGASCVIHQVRRGYLPDILLIQRKTDGLWELPGGQVELNTSDSGDPFLETVIREVGEECGIHLQQSEVVFDSVFQQRVLYKDVLIAGSVLLYYCLHAKEIDLSFTGNETSALEVVNLGEIDFFANNISLAARRMIGVFYSNYQVRRHILKGPKKPQLARNLGSPLVFELNGTFITI